MKSVRDWLRKSRDKPFTGRIFSRTACLPPAETERLLNELLVRGWIEPDKRSAEADGAPRDVTGLDNAVMNESSTELGNRGEFVGRLFAITDEGIRFATKKMMPRISRERAEFLLSTLLVRAADVNDRSDLTHYVNELWVFGSFLGESNDLGDLDIAVNIRKRSSVDGEALIAYAKASGKRFRNFVEELTYGDRQVRQLLKNRSPAISLHDVDELDDLKCESRIVFASQNCRDFVAIRTQKKG